MSDRELHDVVVQQLNSMSAWQHDTTELLRSMSERLARLENSVDNLEKRREADDGKLTELEALKNQGIGAKGVVAAIVAAIPGIVALLKLSL
ncbi:hypothetical protein SELR_pSRC500410 (plasmid) [Selenomonas ruminantium subsp. lactilytica TAM6421]|uniref:Haemolysin XhlA n=1 Tax=Selenomonas ruminantium subsp. lactilytica (strain NBRC 103574 / TAM6421) TaxID=927704 RepID=I0GWS8_SELRL|nr:hypothetical protein [Selenomonas ruminantium]BAL85215.1 hypothetical protein SELR_pSRC500410 [Selenomonas ruminantium subsp. lactilytica TAM6421]